MLISYSQLSVRTLRLDLLLTPLDYICVISLKKCLARLVVVHSRACSSIFFCLSCFSKGVIQFWEMTWALGLKKWLKSWGHWHNT